MSTHVELDAHVGINLITGEEANFQQYRVFLVEDGVRQRVGIIGWHPGAKLLFTRQVDPVTRDWISGEVQRLMKLDSLGKTEVPDIPVELVENTNSEQAFNEFDEKELT